MCTGVFIVLYASPRLETTWGSINRRMDKKIEVYLQKWELMTCCSKQLKPTSKQVRQNLTPPPPQRSLMQNKSLYRGLGGPSWSGLRVPLWQYPQLVCPGSLPWSPTASGWCSCSCSPSLRLPWAFPLQSLCPGGSSPRQSRPPSVTSFSRRDFLTTFFKLYPSPLALQNSISLSCFQEIASPEALAS